MWGDVGRCGEVWGDVGRCGEMWGDVGRYGESSNLRVAARKDSLLLEDLRYGEIWGRYGEMWGRSGEI